jgi:deoxyribodipyrimidine photo-lyase
MSTASLVWLRLDLRLTDHPALCAAAARGNGVAVLFVLPMEGDRAWLGGAASRWWLHHSLAALSRAITDRGGRLILRAGDPAEQVARVARQCGADTVFCHRIIDPDEDSRLHRVRAAVEDAGGRLRVLSPNLLAEPGALMNRAGDPFKVFTPFHRTARQASVAQPIPAPARLDGPERAADSLSLEALELLPRHDWAGGLRGGWMPGEIGALRRMDAFLDGPVARYPEDRDVPGVEGTAKISPHLHFGEVSARTLFHEAVLRTEAAGKEGALQGGEAWLRQLYWREFAHHLLFHYPRLATDPMRPEFSAFPWRGDAAFLDAWQRGRTGYPMVDAGMRELWHTGWMHNRVRMIVASFLVKHLLQPWQAGAEWFADTLVDADLANNTLGWQWTAGCGPDAAPYFRVFNPALQGKRFDPDGAYVRRWVPELAGMDAKHIHGPGGVSLGDGYPRPIVEHAGARQRALLAYEQVRRHQKTEKENQP